MDIGDQPAFARPASEYTAGGTLPDGNDAVQGQRGMTYRQWLAGMAMQAFCEAERDWSFSQTADSAVRMADALIAELSKPNAQLDA